MTPQMTRMASRRLGPQEIFAARAAREHALSRPLVLYISTGLAFLLAPGTFPGVWNLMTISSRRAPDAVSQEWIQVHGHAQIFDWIASFILGMGFDSIPKLRDTIFAVGALVPGWFVPGLATGHSYDERGYGEEGAWEVRAQARGD